MMVILPSPQDYLDWYQSHVGTFHETSLQSVIGILLYRKHVITKQPYIPQLIKHFEKEGLIPLPIFINGVEGHVAVRDWMTTDYEQEQRERGNKEILSLKKDAVRVDAIVSTIGFPLVGGACGFDGSRKTSRSSQTNFICEKCSLYSICTSINSRYSFLDEKRNRWFTECRFIFLFPN